MKLFKIHTILVSLCLVVVSQVLTVSSVLADTKIYPPTFCQLWGPDLRDGMSNFVGYSQFGALSNLHTSRTLHKE